MTESFRYSQSLRIQGAVITAFFLIVMACFSTQFFVDDEAARRLGYFDRHSAVQLACASEIVLGLMFLGGIYAVALGVLGYITVTDSKLAIRTVFRHHRFDVSTVDKLCWKVGEFKLHAGGRKIAMSLGFFSRHDRLRIIRLLRGLIPEAKQQGWPRFCQFTALPLRDGISPIAVARLATASLPEHSFVTIHRSRYNWLGFGIIPAAAVIAFVVWWRQDDGRLFGLLLPITLLFVFLRYSVPRAGMRMFRLSADPTYGAVLGGVGHACACMLAMAVPAVLGLSKVASERFMTFVAIGAVVGAIPVVYQIFRLARRMDLLLKATAESSLAKWEAGESNTMRESTIGDTST